MNTGNDSFESKIPAEHLKALLQLGRKYGFDPTASDEIENYFVKLLGEYKGEEIGFINWIEEKIRCDFRNIKEKPEWIQNPEWKFCGDRPMIFIGQIEMPAKFKYFHDDAVFYIFWDQETGETKSVTQIS